MVCHLFGHSQLSGPLPTNMMVRPLDMLQCRKTVINLISIINFLWKHTQSNGTGIWLLFSFVTGLDDI